jgi:ankyrin repeat protein
MSVCELAASGEIDVLPMLFRYKAVPMDVGDYLGLTPLHIAALRNHVSLVRRLLEEGCSPGMLDQRGFDVASTAENAGHLDLAMAIRTFSCSPLRTS